MYIIIQQKELIEMYKEKKYYSQIDVAYKIKLKTGQNISDIICVLKSLEEVIKDIFSDANNYVEIKLFNGFKMSAKYMSPKQSKSNLIKNIKDLKYVLNLSSVFTDDFRRKIRELHKNNLC